MRILVIEDNEQIAEFLLRGLRSEGHVVDLCRDGRAGLERACGDLWDVVILDLLLPEMDGRQVCYELRSRGFSIPILMLTALDSKKDVIAGLRMGADDYLTKPFSFEELLVRVQKISGRQGTENNACMANNFLQVEDLKLELDTFIVTRGKRQILLTSFEYALLEFLMRESGKLVSKTKILQNVWQTSADPLTNVVEVYISRLRKKVDDETDIKLIHTIRRRGYFLGVRASV